MKKFICALTVLFLMLSLCSCGTVNKSVGFSQGPWQALSVEIYFLEETYRTPDARNIRNENTPLCVIDSTTSDGGEATSALMNEIPSLPFTMEVMYFPAPVDWDYLFEGYVICVVLTGASGAGMLRTTRVSPFSSCSSLYELERTARNIRSTPIEVSTTYGT